MDNDANATEPQLPTASCTTTIEQQPPTSIPDKTDRRRKRSRPQKKRQKKEPAAVASPEKHHTLEFMVACAKGERLAKMQIDAQTDILLKSWKEALHVINASVSDTTKPLRALLVSKSSSQQSKIYISLDPQKSTNPKHRLCPATNHAAGLFLVLQYKFSRAEDMIYIDLERRRALVKDMTKVVLGCIGDKVFYAAETQTDIVDDKTVSGDVFTDAVIKYTTGYDLIKNAMKKFADRTLNDEVKCDSSLILFFIGIARVEYAVTLLRDEMTTIADRYCGLDSAETAEDTERLAWEDVHKCEGWDGMPPEKKAKLEKKRIKGIERAADISERARNARLCNEMLVLLGEEEDDTKL